ncbi:MAG: hypothetical protein ACD_10C00298G0001, partial [uncultured bacterium]
MADIENDGWFTGHHLKTSGQFSFDQARANRLHGDRQLLAQGAEGSQRHCCVVQLNRPAQTGISQRTFDQRLARTAPPAPLQAVFAAFAL